jgi:hypothetical protein
MENHLRANRADVEDLIATAIFPDQVLRLDQITRSDAGARWIEPLIHRYTTLFGALAGSYQLVRYGVVTKLQRRTESPIQRLIAVQPLVSRAPEADRARLLAPMVERVSAHVSTERHYRVELFQLLEHMLRALIPELDAAHALFSQTLDAAFADFDPIDVGSDNYDAMVTFALAHPDLVRAEQRARLDDHFHAFASAELDYIQDESDVDQKLAAFDQLVDIAERLGQTIGLTRERLLEDVEETRDPDEDSYEYGSGRSDDGVSDGDLDNMFDTLVD